MLEMTRDPTRCAQPVHRLLLGQMSSNHCWYLLQFCCGGIKPIFVDVMIKLKIGWNVAGILEHRETMQ
jgi:hypothetical protein